ncbi:MAG: inositol monophosphatase [Acidobacteria bacterium]|nr:inositol monophosphatase [Acidobacteriota bacterium]MBU4306289.1 inositol monophosphatase [Acidobacteriota bacterium]MCG2812356.1 inositol monophosphatase [Candidatus Aminicenantes bacterium]
MNQLLKIALRAAREAGGLICRDFRNVPATDIQAKGKNDFVTRVDKEAETIIKGVIKQNFPDHRLLAEESGYSAKASEYLWVIDPLDGTTNFIHGIPHFAVSLALQKNGKTIFALIYNPLSKDCFHASAGQGAFLNGKAIVVSRVAKLSSALGATGFPFKAPRFLAAYTEAFRSLLSQCKDMRRCGSAALDLAYTACGRYDFFWEAHLLPWDFMAGKLIVEEAGGKTSDFQARELEVKTSAVLAANKALYPKILKMISSHFK